MSKRHGRSIRCEGCGGEHPVNRKNIKAKKGGFLCPKCTRKQKNKERQEAQDRRSAF